MPSININAGLFDCQDSASPWAMVVNMGTTTRINGTQYELNYDWNSAMYDNINLDTDVLLRYTLDGGTSQIYPGTLPDNAVDFVITVEPHDTILLQFEFQVAGGTQCYTYINVPNSSIIPAL